MTDKITTIEGLAELMQRTMASKEDVKRLEQKLEQKIDAGFLAVNRRIDLIREDISDFPTMREGLQDFRQRLERVELKVGIAG